MSSKLMDLDEIVEIAIRDKPFYDASGGGVTCSGGEPTLSIEFLTALLERLKAAGIRTAVDTAANVPWRQYQRLMPVTDLFLVDFKLRDEAAHRLITDVGNGTIMDNLRRFAAYHVPVIVRIPVIPGVNCDEGSIAAMADYLREIGFRGAVELLKFHHWGEAKYKALGLDYPFSGVEPPDDAFMERLCELVRGSGVNVTG
jgi:pyruvate formate lyase activating enzyme